MTSKSVAGGTRAGLLGALGGHMEFPRGTLAAQSSGGWPRLWTQLAGLPVAMPCVGFLPLLTLTLPLQYLTPPPQTWDPGSQHPRSIQKTCLPLDILKFLYLETSHSF